MPADWQCGYCTKSSRAIGQPFCEECGMTMGLKETRERRLEKELIGEAQRLRGFMEEWKTRDLDEAEAIIDFIDAVDAYNLRNG